MDRDDAAPGLTDRGLAFEAVPYDGSVAQQLIAEVQAEYVVRYGGPDEAVVDPAEFLAPSGLLLVAFQGQVAVAMGGFRRLSADEAEIKRMYVPSVFRRQGISRRMLSAIEEAAREAGVRRLVLNTGIMQPEAIALYESSGYSVIAGFGHYADAPDARFYAKDLHA